MPQTNLCWEGNDLSLACILMCALSGAVCALTSPIGWSFNEIASLYACKHFRKIHIYLCSVNARCVLQRTHWGSGIKKLNK